MPRRPKPEIQLPYGIVIGGLVGYYDNGNRYGHLESVSGTYAKVRPIAAYKSNSPNCVTVPIDQLKGV